MRLEKSKDNEEKKRTRFGSIFRRKKSGEHKKKSKHRKSRMSIFSSSKKVPDDSIETSKKKTEYAKSKKDTKTKKSEKQNVVTTKADLNHLNDTKSSHSRYSLYSKNLKNKEPNEKNKEPIEKKKEPIGLKNRKNKESIRNKKSVKFAETNDENKNKETKSEEVATSKTRQKSSKNDKVVDEKIGDKFDTKNKRKSKKYDNEIIDDEDVNKTNDKKEKNKSIVHIVKKSLSKSGKKKKERNKSLHLNNCDKASEAEEELFPIDKSKNSRTEEGTLMLEEILERWEKTKWTNETGHTKATETRKKSLLDGSKRRNKASSGLLSMVRKEKKKGDGRVPFAEFSKMVAKVMAEYESVIKRQKAIIAVKEAEIMALKGTDNSHYDHCGNKTTGICIHEILLKNERNLFEKQVVDLKVSVANYMDQVNNLQFFIYRNKGSFKNQDI